MGNVIHKTLSPANNHIVHSFEYADATARTAATGFLSTDVGRVARQLSDNTFWVLVSISPISWTGIGSGGGGSLTFKNQGVGSVTGTTLDIVGAVGRPLPFFFFQEAAGVAGLVPNRPWTVGSVNAPEAGGPGGAFQLQGDITALTAVGTGVYDVTFATVYSPPSPGISPGDLTSQLTLTGAGTAVRGTAVMTAASNVRVSLFDAGGLPADGGFFLVVFF